MAIITDITIHPVLSTASDFRGLCAYASITLDNEFRVRGIKIIQVYAEDRYFVQFPSDTTKRSSSNDIAHPTNTGARRRYESAVIQAYLKFIEESKDQPPSVVYKPA